ncbi:MAG TPA: hypothetical protein PKX00_10180 [Opitutaceae bacterium]|jgi:hypothetical protein|nr:hypothetical protein [Opitutaceae bacterium]HRE05966.1 hypothetical protein [Opitutaceae bacterium]
MSTPKPRATSLWVGVAAGFLLLAVAWTTLFVVASKHRPADVPLERPAVVR